MTPTPPPTRRSDVVDVLHGEQVADPYRWLEDTEATETRAWIEAQNQVTLGYLESLAGRDEIRSRLAEVWDATRYGAPYEHDGRWFFTRHAAGADQPALHVSTDPSDDGRVLVDPNTLSADGTTSLAQWHVSRDGRLVTYALSEAGSDWMTWRVRDVESGSDLPDVIEWSKWSGAVWLPDGSGFVYGALDAPEPGQEYLGTTDQLRLVLHRLGTQAADDDLVYLDSEQRWESYATSAGAGRWLVITTEGSRGPETRLYVADLATTPLEIRPLVPTPDAHSIVVGAQGTTFFVMTDDGAPNRRIVAIDLDQPAKESWREVVPEGAHAIIDAAEAGESLVVQVLADAASQLQVWTKAGERLADIDLPYAVTVTEVSGGESDLVHFGVNSFTDPASVWSCDLSSGAVRRVHDAGAPIDAASLTVTRASAPSADGTEIPMFLLHRRDVTPTGDVPTLLYGYGGFDIPVTPTFNAARLVWVERGGLLAVANLRGGGEYGKAWYDAGRLANKQNVFDDFAGCARWLATSGWSRPERIAVNGGSNGGLLVGATLTQHPELIGAAVPEVGVMDMLRYHRFTVGWAWMSDYGDPDDPEQYQWVRAFSPLHNVTPGTSYPPTLVMTGDHDDRVVPGHSFKFAATMQAAQAGSAPVLIRVETSAGHGAATPVSKLIDARADMLAFCEAAVGTS